MNTLGRWLFSLGLLGIGILNLIYRDFAMSWQPAPEGLPQRALLASLSGAILVFGGAGLWVRPWRRWAALALAVSVTLWWVLLQLPRVVAAPGNAGVWLGFAENALLVAGGWLVSFASVGTTPRRLASLLVVLYGMSLPVIGWSHFVYADFTAGMVPSWLPFHLGFAYLTGAGHIAAGVAILTRLLAPLAARLEAAMLGCFVTLLHLPGVLAAPKDRLQWTMLSIAVAMTGAAALVAGEIKHPVKRV